MANLVEWNEGLALAVAVAAGISDWRCRRIPNWLTCSAMGAGIVLQLLVDRSGWPAPFLGIGLGLGVLVIPFLAGGMGAGDVKLLMALGACVGPQSLWRLFLYAGVAGGVFSLGYLTYRLGWLGMLVRVRLLVESLWDREQRMALRALNEAGRPQISYGSGVLGGGMGGLLI